MNGLPTRFGRHPKDSGSFVVILILKIKKLAEIGFSRSQLLAIFLKGIRDVFQEDEAEHDVFIFRGIDVFTELVSSLEELLFEGLSWLFCFFT